MIGNEICLENTFIPSLLAKIKDITYAQEQQAQITLRGVTRQEKRIGWSCPCPSWLKLNTDGASKANGLKAAAGGLLRDEFGHWQGGCTQNIGVGSTLAAELWGVLQGLKLAWRLGIAHLKL